MTNFYKKGVKGNNFIDLMLVLVLAVFLVYIFGFVSAGTMIGALNITNLSGGQFNATFNYNTSGAAGGFLVTTVNLAKVNESIMYRYNLTVSHIAATENLTGINITLPPSFTYFVGSNDTGNTSGATWTTAVWFNATPTGASSGGQMNGSILSWNATAGIATQSGYIINNTGGGNATQIMFNATAWTPGTYNLTVRFIYNNTQINTAVNYNETNVTVIVADNTIPFNVNVTSNASGVAWKNANVSGTVIVNVSAFDNGNLTAGAREYDVRSVNVSIINASGGYNASYSASNVTGKYWNASIVTTQFLDGVYNITIYANDTAGNTNVTSFNVTFDNTAPTGSVSCTPSDITVGNAETCTCSPSDALSGVNSSATTVTASPSTSSSGTFTQTCSFADLAGNTGTASDTYYVRTASTSTGSSSSSSSGTSSAGTTTGAIVGTPNLNVIGAITPGTPAVVTGAQSSGINEIKLEVSSPTTNTQVTVTNYDGKPAAVTVDTPVKTAYKYLQINTQDLASKLSKATLKFQVEKSWVTSNGLTKDKVSVFKIDTGDTKWNELPLAYASEDTTYYYYTTSVNSFSYFVIGQKAEAATGNNGTASQTTLTGRVSNSMWWIIGGVIAILLIVGWIVWNKRK